jgi:hypothetical protein
VSLASKEIDESTGSRPIRSTAYPEISVVVVSTAADSVAEFLDVLLPQVSRHGATVVVSSTHSREVANCQGRFPEVTFVRMPEGSGSAELRAGGMAASDGDVVVLTETAGGVLPPGWMDQHLQRRGLASQGPNQ